jgi:predicted Zn-dependent protease
MRMCGIFRPSLSESFDQRLTHDAEHAFAGGLLFILLHELGHLELRHSALSQGTAGATAPTLACVEDVNFRKEQEFEADAFAFHAMVPRARSMLIVNAWYVMGLILDYESLAGNRNNTHPLAINRIAKLNELSGALDDAAIAESAAKMFKARLNVMESRLKAVHPDEHLLPTEVRTKINQEAYLKALGRADESRMAVDRLIQAYRAIPAI